MGLLLKDPYGHRGNQTQSLSLMSRTPIRPLCFEPSFLSSAVLASQLDHFFPDLFRLTETQSERILWSDSGSVGRAGAEPEPLLKAVI